MLELHTLGGVRLEGDGAGAAELVRHSKSLALLTYLCVAGDGGTRRRDQLVALLWPESSDEHGRGSLRKALFQLRHTLGQDVLRGTGDEDIGVDSDRIWCDAAASRAALADERWEDALALYRGAFLDGMHVSGAPEFERWLDEEREELRRGAASAAWRLVESREEDGRGPEALRWARRALDLAPYDEAGFRRLVALCDRNGDRATALREYERFRRRLREDLDVDPAPETRAVVQALRLRQQPTPLGGSRRNGRRRSSVAVLPFCSLGGDGMGRLFADGLHNEIIFRLGSTSGLQVTSRTSVMTFRDCERTAPEIAAELGVGTLIEGSLHMAGRRVRLTLQMIDPDCDEACWCGSWEGELDDPLQAQVDMAREVAREMAATVRLGCHGGGPQTSAGQPGPEG